MYLSNIDKISYFFSMQQQNDEQNFLLHILRTIFHNRPSATGGGGKVGSTGIHQRPYHLAPLTKDPQLAPTLPQIGSKAGVPAPSGLHLSVNYTNNLDAGKLPANNMKTFI